MAASTRHSVFTKAPRWALFYGGRVDVSRLDFVRSGKYVLAKRGMMCSYSTQMTSNKEQGLAR